MGKIKKRKNDTHAINKFFMIWVIGQLPDGSYRGLRNWSLPSDNDRGWGGPSPPQKKIENNKVILQCFLGNIKCFNLMFFSQKKEALQSDFDTTSTKISGFWLVYTLWMFSLIGSLSNPALDEPWQSSLRCWLLRLLIGNSVRWQPYPPT